jgi:hypothetical protein
MRDAPVPNAVPETSSEPLTIPVEQQALFRGVLALLERKNISYVVAGAFALFEHTGICPDTRDLDVFLTPENAALALQHLREEGPFYTDWDQRCASSRSVLRIRDRHQAPAHDRKKKGQQDIS